MRDFDEEMWYVLVDHVTAGDGTLAFVFKSGETVDIAI